MTNKYHYLGYQYRKARKKILARDEYRCQRCGLVASASQYSKGKPHLVVHHIKPLNDGGDDSADNLITLCTGCHTKIHQIGG